MARPGEAHSPAGVFAPATLETYALLYSDTWVSDEDTDIWGLRGQSMPERNVQRDLRKEARPRRG